MAKLIGGFEDLTLPAGERLLWQGRPNAVGLALRVFHVRGVMAWFAIIFGGRVIAAVIGGQALMPAMRDAAGVAIPAAIALGLIAGLAAVYGRSTRYSLTNRRVLLQFGVALPMTLNIPLAQVTSADLKLFADGSGDLPLRVKTDQRLAWLLLWPHARPWRLSAVEPMLRSVPDASRVAHILAGALAETHPAQHTVAARVTAEVLAAGSPVIANAA